MSLCWRDEYTVPKQILNLLDPQYTVTEDNGSVVFRKRIGDYTVSVCGCQPGRMSVHVVVQGGGKLQLMQNYSYLRDDVDGICRCLKTLIDRYENRRY